MVIFSYDVFTWFFLLVSECRKHPRNKHQREKSKGQINRRLNESIINGERHENKELQDKVEKVEKSDKVADIILEF